MDVGVGVARTSTSSTHAHSSTALNSHADANDGTGSDDDDDEGDDVEKEGSVVRSSLRREGSASLARRWRSSSALSTSQVEAGPYTSSARSAA